MAVLREGIKRFLTIATGDGSIDSSFDGSDFGCGSGCGFCSGLGWDFGSFFGTGDGSSFGDGDGSGCGSGFGDGDGSGCGSGDGDGLISFNRQDIHYIDEIPTVILNVHGNLAKGFTINSDLTTRECFVAKGHNLFAHGDTAKDAEDALKEKIMESMDPEEKIDLFLAEFKPGEKYPAMVFFDWHHKLTGSCEFGRRSFVMDHGIDLENGTYTVEEFCEITRDSYGGEIIKQLEERIKEDVES